MISHFDIDATQLSVALGVDRVVGEDVAAFDARENTVVNARRLIRRFQIFRPSTRQLGHAGQRHLLAKYSLSARAKILFENGRWLTPPSAPFLFRLKQSLKERPGPFHELVG